MKTLKELLPKQRGVPELAVVDTHTVFFLCRKVIVEEYGVRGGENITPTLFREGKLYLSTRSSLWANEVRLQKEILRDRINRIVGTESVVEIRLSQPH